MTVQSGDLSARERLLEAAARLLADSGGAPISTRAVCEAAGVRAPTLYHHFGDKQGLLDAVASHGFETFLAGKRALEAAGDPIEDLRRGWDDHVEFGLTHPALYALMYGSPRPGRRPAAADEAERLLLGRLRRAAQAGRLRLPPEAAARTVLAANVGVVVLLTSDPGQNPDPDLSPRTRDAVLAAITTAAPDAGPSAAEPAAGPAVHAIALAAALDDGPAGEFTPAERALLREWLGRLAKRADGRQ
jgi:AcrR family transcriptional regulator